MIAYIVKYDLQISGEFAKTDSLITIGNYKYGIRAGVNISHHLSLRLHQILWLQSDFGSAISNLLETDCMHW